MNDTKRKDSIGFTENQYNIGICEALRNEAKKRNIPLATLLTEIFLSHQNQNKAILK